MRSCRKIRSPAGKAGPARPSALTLIQDCLVLGRSIHRAPTLVQFAGTRYRKRGVNDAGFVANDVEVEQGVEAGTDWRTGEPRISSVVQVRRGKGGRGHGAKHCSAGRWAGRGL